MGKDSLLESTSKKKTAAKADKEKPAKKKTAAKKTTSKKTTAKKATTSAKKAAPAKAKKTAAAKKTTKKAVTKKTAAAKKTTAKKAAPAKTAGKAKKTAQKAPAKKKTATKKPTRKELLWKKFETYPVSDLYKMPVAPPQATGEAPSFFSGMSDADAKKAKEYLQRKFDWAEIKAAGEKYAVKLAAQAEEEAKRKAEEEAKRKAEEEAKRKAEEEAKRKAEEEAKRKAEEEAKRKAEEEAKRKAEEEAKRKAEEEAKRKAEEQLPPPPSDKGAGLAGGLNPIKIGIVGFCAIILLLVFSSYSNTKKYYIEDENGAVEIWRGTFAPMGKTRLMIMPGIQMPAEQKEVYAWQDAYRLMYQYYIEKADAILEVPGVPDTAGLTVNLEKAISYAPNRELRDAARARLMSIRMQTLVHKAQAMLNRGTVESATAAIGFLEEAVQYDLSAAEAEMVQRKIEEAQAVLAEREKAQAEAEKAAAEQAALEAEAQKLEEASENQAPVAAEDGH